MFKPIKKQAGRKRAAEDDSLCYRPIYGFPFALFCLTCSKHKGNVCWTNEEGGEMVLTDLDEMQGQYE